MKSHVLLTVWCNISGEAAGEIWHWSLSGVKGLLFSYMWWDPWWEPRPSHKCILKNNTQEKGRSHQHLKFLLLWFVQYVGVVVGLVQNTWNLTPSSDFPQHFTEKCMCISEKVCSHQLSTKSVCMRSHSLGNFSTKVLISWKYLVPHFRLKIYRILLLPSFQKIFHRVSIKILLATPPQMHHVIYPGMIP